MFVNAHSLQMEFWPITDFIQIQTILCCFCTICEIQHVDMVNSTRYWTMHGPMYRCLAHFKYIYIWISLKYILTLCGSTIPLHRAIRLSSSFFDGFFGLGVAVEDPVWLVIVGRLSAAAARSARKRSNSLLVRLSSGPSSSTICECKKFKNG